MYLTFNISTNTFLGTHYVHWPMNFRNVTYFKFHKSIRISVIKTVFSDKKPEYVKGQLNILISKAIYLFHYLCIFIEPLLSASYFSRKLEHKWPKQSLHSRLYRGEKGKTDIK